MFVYLIIGYKESSILSIKEFSLKKKKSIKEFEWETNHHKKKIWETKVLQRVLSVEKKNKTTNTKQNKTKKILHKIIPNK